MGRDPDTWRYLPAEFVVVADSMDEAAKRHATLDSLVHYDGGIGSLNSMLGFDVSGYDADGSLPDIPETEIGRWQRECMVNLAREKRLTIRVLARAAGSYSSFAFVGAATSIAGQMQEWLGTQASGGFDVMFRWIPGGLDEVVDKLAPKPQRRGLFRRGYQGHTCLGVSQLNHSRRSSRIPRGSACRCVAPSTESRRFTLQA
ncbi:hypothetical protein AAB992_25370 [Burkholderia contaminans]|nr:hypothetical protein [Burkholderia contaminans]WFN14641.1 hypothetical protein LXE92_37805 [Burkholderia contaminans]